LTSLAPELDISVNLRCPEQVGLTSKSQRFVTWSRAVHVVASDLMLRAITTKRMVRNIDHDLEYDHSPLWKCLVATNVPSFASLATLSGLRMTTRTTLILLEVLERGFGFLTHLRRDGPPPGPAIE
jgi:hypothetical protein